MSSYTAKFIVCAWLLSLALCSLITADASGTFDAVPLIQQKTQQLTTSDLADTLSLLIDILAKHNIRKESSALQQYVEQLQAVLQPDCCDYFTALPTVKGLSAALPEVLQLQLPAALRPVVRRSYVGAIWLLQRSRFFNWDSHTLQKSAMSGMYKLFEAHMAAAAGRPISFHHISKTGGTSLCSVAWDNGCRGPGMSKKDNCLLDTGADGPVWVLRHNVTAINRVTPVPPPPQPPPVMADAAAEEEWLQLAVATHRMLKQRSYDWWMYDCPVERLAVSVGRGCGELQEGAVSKSATFFASENTLPTEHGSPQVCEAFVNVVMVRESVGEVVSLMTEVALVYTRLLKQHRVLGWTPPKWDLNWWQQWAPLVVNSYATRTLLGAAAYCPAAPVQFSPALQPGQNMDASSSSSGGGGGGGSTGALPWVLSADDVRRALQVLASFDLVLDLGSLELIDESLTKLLGWSGQTYSKGRHQRRSQAASPPTWEQLELLARQIPPPLKSSLLPGVAAGSNGASSSSSSSDGGESRSNLSGAGSAAAAAAAGSAEAAAASQQQQGNTPASSPADSRETGTTAGSINVDSIRRLIGEVHVRQLYSSHRLSGVLLPLAPEVPLLQPPAAVVTAAIATLAAARQGPITIETVTGVDGSSHLLVKLQVGQTGPVSKLPLGQAGPVGKPSAGQAGPGTDSAAAAAAMGAGANAGLPAGTVSYHVWLKHGVVLSESQYQQLLRATAADAQLYRAGRVMQALDAGWASVLGQQRSVRKMMAQAQEEAGSACGFAGLNHMQA